MKAISVWMEGYWATGCRASTLFCGTFKANNLREACQKWVDQEEGREEYYDAKNNTYWGCRFFDNETEARKIYG